MRDQLIILNSFVHDVATGTWISSLLVTALLKVEARAWTAPPVARFAQLLQGRLLWLTWIALAIIVLTGAVRALTFRAYGWTGDVARDRVRLLKIKHAVLGLVVAGGTAWQVALSVLPS